MSGIRRNINGSDQLGRVLSRKKVKFQVANGNVVNWACGYPVALPQFPSCQFFADKRDRGPERGGWVMTEASTGFAVRTTMGGEKIATLRQLLIACSPASLRTRKGKPVTERLMLSRIAGAPKLEDHRAAKEGSE